MSNEQLFGIGLLALGAGLFLWSTWPSLAKVLVKPSPDKPKEPDSKPSQDDAVEDWALLHLKVAELSEMLSGNPVAKAKLNELGAALYDPKNWGQNDAAA